MLNIPYEQQKDSKACALACYTMVARYFFPEVIFSDIAKISGWEPGYVVWPFKFWLWILDKGIVVENYDSIDYESWAQVGSEALRQSVPEKEFDYYQKNTKDLESYKSDIAKLLKNPNFHYYKQKPTIENLKEALREGHVCEIIINSKSGTSFSLHRVVVLAVDGGEVNYHDPSSKGGPNMKMDEKTLIKCWLEDITESELCIYKKPIS